MTKIFVSLLLFATCVQSAAQTLAVPNDNRAPAGSLQDGSCDEILPDGFTSPGPPATPEVDWIFATFGGHVVLEQPIGVE